MSPPITNPPAATTPSDVVLRVGAEHVDCAQLHALLRETYWAHDRPLALIERAVRNSFCVSAWCDVRMIGFARAITDFACHAYLADVIVHPDWRGRGLGTRLVRRLVDHEAMRTCLWTLHTRDAHAVYAPLGFRDRPAMSRPRRTWRPG